MDELIKIRDLSVKYNISARTLRYYEDIGLISSIRSENYAYRLYDNDAITRIEQILILRKLNVSIKDIQHIFNSPGTEIVLQVLNKKISAIDEDVASLEFQELKVLGPSPIVEEINFPPNLPSGTCVCK